MAAAELTTLGGLHSLAGNQNRVILTDNAREADALAELTPKNPVVWFNGIAADMPFGQLTGREVIVWTFRPQASYWLAPSAQAWLQRLLAVASGVRVVCDDDAPGPARLLAQGAPEAIGDWLKPLLKLGSELLPSNVVPIRAAAPAQAPANPTSLAEDTLANAFTARHPNLRYVAEWGKWLEWDGEKWLTDNTGHAMHCARVLCAAEADAAAVDGATLDAVKKAKKASTRAAVENMARSDPRHAAESKCWDANTYALATPGGIVDLRTGELRPATMDDYATKRTLATPRGQCPTWLRFLSEATGGDQALQDYLQRVAGYLLTGDTREECFFFVYGEGGNGKGTFLNTLTGLLGDYSVVASMETFLEQRNSQHTTDLARLRGARMVSAQEIGEGKRWNEGRLREITGGDTITARFMRQDNFEFKPQFKLIMAANERPTLRTVDAAIKRRLHLIPFTVDFTGKRADKTLKARLADEAGGILLWAIHGCIEWQRTGLLPPAIVRDATEEYLEEQDTLKAWINECCELGSSLRDGVKALYENYTTWCQEANEYAAPLRRFREKLGKKGFRDGRDRHGMYIEGIKRADSGTIKRGYQTDIPGF